MGYLKLGSVHVSQLQIGRWFTEQVPFHKQPNSYYAIAFILQSRL